MRIIAKKLIKEFWGNLEFKDSEQQLKTWYKLITERSWANPQEITGYFKGADNVGNGRIVFNVCGNKYRLIVFFRFDIQIGYIRFLDTHKNYNKIKDIKNI